MWLLAQPMDRLAEGMGKTGRSSIEETGNNNILYLTFGCLEWSEKNKSFFAQSWLPIPQEAGSALAPHASLSTDQRRSLMRGAGDGRSD